MTDLVGLRVRDRVTGLVTLDITDRLTRLIGSVDSGLSPNSIVVPGFLTGDGWAAVLEAPPPNDNLARRWRYPRTIISGSTLSWDFPGDQSEAAVSCLIIYGVY